MKSKLGKNEFLSIWILLSIFVLLAVIVVGLWYYSSSALPDNVGRQLSSEETEAVIAKNSPLTDYVYLSPNADFPRSSPISKITIHRMSEDMSVEELGERFSYRDRKVSANYAVDSNGHVGLYVEEANRARTSGGAGKDNDDMAVTIEVADAGMRGDYAITDEAYAKLIELCADICRRNNIAQLDYTGDSQGNLTLHRMFSSGVKCPGHYLEEKIPEIVRAVNEQLE